MLHVAVTGCSYTDKPIYKIRKKRVHEVYKVKYFKKEGHIPGTRFNPESINLYDEDIEQILNSGGLIGLILDERALGFSKHKYIKEFISNVMQIYEISYYHFVFLSMTKTRFQSNPLGLDLLTNNK